MAVTGGRAAVMQHELTRLPSWQNNKDEMMTSTRTALCFCDRHVRSGLE